MSQEQASGREGESKRANRTFLRCDRTTERINGQTSERATRRRANRRRRCYNRLPRENY